MELGLKRNEVRLVEHSQEWKNNFLEVKQEIINATGISENRIEHIGSTAIKGISAKPIIDIAIGVDDLKNVEKAIFQGLKEIGFLRLRVERPNEIVLAKFTDKTFDKKTHYIHLVEYEGGLWKNLLFFRDYLNANQAVREAYEQLKKTFLEESSGGINEYTDYKEEFVKGIFQKRTS